MKICSGSIINVTYTDTNLWLVKATVDDWRPKVGDWLKQDRRTLINLTVLSKLVSCRLQYTLVYRFY
jgi:hypothetical protein